MEASGSRRDGHELTTCEVNTYYMCMPQLHLSVPKETAKALQERARSRGVSVSRLLAEIVEREVVVAGWPEGYFEKVVAGWSGPLDRAPQGKLEKRQPL